MLYSTIHHHQQGECARSCMEQRTCHQSDHPFVSTFTFLFIFIGVPSGSHCLIQLLKVKVLIVTSPFGWIAQSTSALERPHLRKQNLKAVGWNVRKGEAKRGGIGVLFVAIDATDLFILTPRLCWCTERDPVLSAARHLDTIGCLLFIFFYCRKACS